MTMEVVVDYSKVHDGHLEYQNAAGKIMPDIIQLQTLQDFPYWKSKRLLMNCKPIAWNKIYKDFKDKDGVPKAPNDKLTKYVRGNSGKYYKESDPVDADGNIGAPDQDIRLKINEKSITLNHLSDDLKNYIDNRSAAGGTSGAGSAAPTNITSTTLNVTDDGGNKKIELKNDTVDSDHLKENAVTKKLANSLKTNIAEIDNKANIDATNIDTDILNLN